MAQIPLFTRVLAGSSVTDSINYLINQINSLVVGNSSSGGGYSYSDIVTTGSTAPTPLPGTFVGFNSASGASKTVTLPTATGSLLLITVMDLYGDAGTNNITINGVTWGPNVIYVNGNALTFIDLPGGYAAYA
jgi:hypothetical protein